MLSMAEVVNQTRSSFLNHKGYTHPYSYAKYQRVKPGLTAPSFLIRARTSLDTICFEPVRGFLVHAPRSERLVGVILIPLLKNNEYAEGRPVRYILDHEVDGRQSMETSSNLPLNISVIALGLVSDEQKGSVA